MGGFLSLQMTKDMKLLYDIITKEERLERILGVDRAESPPSEPRPHKVDPDIARRMIEIWKEEESKRHASEASTSGGTDRPKGREEQSMEEMLANVHRVIE